MGVAREESWREFTSRIEWIRLDLAEFVYAFDL